MSESVNVNVSESVSDSENSLTSDGLLTEYQDTFSRLLPDFAPGAEVTRNWRARADMRNAELQHGHLTILYQGEGGNDDSQIYVGFLLIARQYCGKGANGLKIEQTELHLLKAIRRILNAELPAVQITKTSSSQQQECPDAWIICQCKAGPYDFTSDDWLGDDQQITGFNVGQAPRIGEAHESDYVALEGCE